MTKAQELLAKKRKLEREIREARAELGEIALAPERTDDQENRSKALQTRLPDAEREWLETDTTLGAAGGEERFEANAEQREMVRLHAGASVGQIFASAIAGRLPQGETAEIQQHYGLTGNQVPLALLRGAHARILGDVEHRAVTPGPGNVGASQAEILLPPFSTGDGGFLDIPRPIVAAGDAVYPALGTRPTVGVKARGNSDDIPDTTGAFTAVSVEPSRVQASFIYRRTDAARFGGMDPALRTALNLGLGEALDVEAVKAIVADAAQDAAGAAVETYATLLTRVIYDEVDGRYAPGADAIRVLMGTHALAYMAGAYRSNNSDVSAEEKIRAIAGGIRVSPNAPARTAADKLQEVIVRKGSAADAVQPVWDGISLVTDEITLVGKGEIEITGILMAGQDVVRADAFKRVQLRYTA